MKDNLKAMVLAAGVGSRLDPLTMRLPKPLIPVANRPVMEHILMWLNEHGIKDVASNLHYLPQKIRNYFTFESTVPCSVQFVHERVLSGDCGGLRSCRNFFEPAAGADKTTFVVVMGDIVTDVDLSRLVVEHRQSGALASIGLKRVDDVSQFGVVCLNKNGFVHHFQEKPLPQEAQSDLANIGIYVFDSDIFNYIPQNGMYMFGKQLFPTLLANKLPVRGVELDGYWSDIGTLESYKQTCSDVLSGATGLSPRGAVKSTGDNKTIVVRGQNVHIAPGAQLMGNVTIGDNCVIASNAVIKDSVIWSNTIVGAGAKVKNCVVADGCRVKQNAQHLGEILVDGLGGYQTSELNVVPLSHDIKLAS